jgi:3-isopropylmalate/(R)-2-methylmalate dehydratase small subunit
MSSNDRCIRSITGTIVPVVGDAIDTDRIIPARFMKGITFDGLGAYAFYDERFDGQGNKKVHPLNDERYSGGNILLVESNFGCGSSREHAPQALMRFGIRALIGISFADIFAGNCSQMGIPAVRVTRDDHGILAETIDRNPKTAVTVDLVAMKIIAGTRTVPLDIDAAACKALVSGLWDTTALLRENLDLIRVKAGQLPYLDW